MKNFCFEQLQEQQLLLRFAQEAMMAIKYGFIIKENTSKGRFMRVLNYGTPSHTLPSSHLVALSAQRE